MEFKTKKTWIEDIELFEDHFTVNKNKIEYKNVIKLWYNYEIYRKGVSEVRGFEFMIYLKSGKEIYQGTKKRRVFLDIATLGITSLSPSEELQKLFALLSKRTFKYRVYKYEQIYNKHKFWFLGDEFGDEIFMQDYFKDGKLRARLLHTRKKGQKTKVVGSLYNPEGELAIDYIYDYAVLTFRKAEIGKMDKFKNEFRKSKDKVDEYSISLNTDPDIRRYILEEKIGLNLDIKKTFIEKLLFNDWKDK